MGSEKQKPRFIWLLKTRGASRWNEIWARNTEKRRERRLDLRDLNGSAVRDVTLGYPFSGSPKVPLDVTLRFLFSRSPKVYLCVFVNLLDTLVIFSIVDRFSLVGVEILESVGLCCLRLSTAAFGFRLLQEDDQSFSQFTASGDFSFGFERSEILVREPPQETTVSGPRSAEYLDFGKRRMWTSSSDVV
ncbi:hypothetical protein MA16_Dca022021 [Dendrobium catenatum]|uniref:Uncharacterized protein n=1 Tax=Dendrobium catenatum TaxID=906689 RepID=A0A2I0X6B8_9ASPA|nr:hypothetical protein MA16_Dca022021 [Dendrobium catenatum]